HCVKLSLYISTDFFFFFFMLRPPRRCTLFPYTTLFRSSRDVEEVASSTNFDDFAWSYGAGAGFLILLSDNVSEGIGSLYLNLKARYIFGSEAEYLKEGSVRIENSRVHYDVSKSKTDLLQIHLGVTAYFNSFN